jgi:hypothetical protein
VLGKVVMCIPYFGLITIFMQNKGWTLPAVVGLIMLLIAVEFSMPIVKQRRRKKRFEQQNEQQTQP